jgi:hypothetical protein
MRIGRCSVVVLPKHKEFSMDFWPVSVYWRKWLGFLWRKKNVFSEACFVHARRPDFISLG